MYKEWNHLTWRLNHDGINKVYRTLFETRKSLILHRLDTEEDVYITIMHTSQKCYQVFIIGRSQIIQTRVVYDQRLSFRCLNDLADYIYCLVKGFTPKDKPDR